MQEYDIVYLKDIPDIMLVGCLFCIFRGCVSVLYPCKDCEYNCLINFFVDTGELLDLKEVKINV